MTRPLAMLAVALAAVACSDPKDRSPEAVAGGLRYPVAVAADSQAVYCIQATGALTKVAKADGAKTELAPVLDAYDTPEGTVPVIVEDGFSVAVDGTSAFFTTFNFESGMRTGIVWKVGLDGSGLTALAKYPGEPAAVAVDESRVFVARYPYGKPAEGVVESLPKSGGEAVVLARNRARPSAIVAGGSEVIWMDVGEDPGDAQGGALASVPKAGGTVKELATQLRWPQGLQLVGADVYWLDRGSKTRSGSGGASNGDGTIGVVKAGSAPKVLINGREQLVSFAVSGEKLFFLDTYLYAAKLGTLSEEVELIAGSMPDGATGNAVSNLLADGDTLWWATTGREAQVVKLTP